MTQILDRQSFHTDSEQACRLGRVWGTCTDVSSRLKC